jgi:hypothetical protein
VAIQRATSIAERRTIKLERYLAKCLITNTKFKGRWRLAVRKYGWVVVSFVDVYECAYNALLDTILPAGIESDRWGMETKEPASVYVSRLLAIDIFM